MKISLTKFKTSAPVIVFCLVLLLKSSYFNALLPIRLYSPSICPNFDRLSHNAISCVDYTINFYKSNSDVSIIAIHGGKIEPGTSEIADSLYKMGKYSFYEFKGIKPKDNFLLHVPSEDFDEPICVCIVKSTKYTISIHGCSGSDSFTYIGGLDRNLGAFIENRLELNGFVVKPPTENLAGKNKYNIANRNIRNMGVHLEISQGLRSYLLDNPTAMEMYTKSLKEGLSDFLQNQ